MLIEIRDYRGVERADIDLDKIALVAGRNEQGKTCVAEATRAALCGMPIPIPGVLKKDAKILVRDGAERGHARIAVNDDDGQTVSWPQAEVVSDGEPITCTDFASGFTHLLDLDPKARASTLARYIKSAPTQEEVEAAARDAGYQDSAIEKIWAGVQQSWDTTYQRARDYTVKLKGQWQEVTGEKYGAKKGADWRPDPEPGNDRDALITAVSTAEENVLATAGAVAVSDAEVQRLKRQVAAKSQAENRIELNNELTDIRATLDGWLAERAAIPDDEEARRGMLPIACPDCGAALVAEQLPEGGLTLLKYEAPKPVDESAAKKLQARREKIDAVIKEHEDEVSALESRINTASSLIADAESARARLKEIEAAPKLDEVTVQQAKDELSRAQASLRAFDAKARADKLHADLVKNEKLLAILAPDGLRRRKLASKLDELNSRLAAICASAAWPVVRLDENLEGHYGTRPVWAASKSGQWRAQTVLQIALTQIDGSAAMILDEADMLDKRGRNGLFTALQFADVRAIVCMTLNQREQVPNLAAAGLGHSYWIEGGTAEAIA